MVQSIRKQTESEDIVLDLDEKDSEEAAEEETKKYKKMRLSEPHFLWKVRWQLAVKFCLPIVIPIKKFE
ncbi:hypothetical protein SD436_06615 [Streptococcus sp. 2A/TPW/M5]